MNLSVATVESLYINSFAGERHDFFKKTSKGGPHGFEIFTDAPPLNISKNSHDVPQQNYLYTGILH